MKNKAKPKPTTAKLFYGDGQLRIESNGAIAGIEIAFRGKPTFDWALPDDWTAAMGAKKILIYSLGVSDLPEFLGAYSGYFQVFDVIVASWDAEKIPVVIELENIQLWERLNTNWEDLTKKWEDLDRGWTS